MTLLSSDYSYLIFPGLLFVFYLVAWFFVGRDPRMENVAPQYDAPPGVSPGVARYILIGGSDGTTLAAVAASLAAKGVVTIEPAQKSYRLELIDSSKSVFPEEAALAASLFHVELPVEPYPDGKATAQSAPPQANDANAPGAQAAGAPSAGATSAGATPGGLAQFSAAMEQSSAVSAGGAAAQPATNVAVIDTMAVPEIQAHINVIQDAFRKNLEGVYFSHHFIFVGLGALATLVWGLGNALFLDDHTSLFLTFWLFGFTSIAGLVIGGYWASRPTQPTPGQRATRLVVPVLFFAMPGAVIYFLALPHSHGFVLALLLSVVLNSVFFVIMRSPTALGRATLQQLAGLCEFLARVEQDRLNRLNSPAERAALMDRFLPYAIAMGVREGWGDTMAAALSDKIVER